MLIMPINIRSIHWQALTEDVTTRPREATFNHNMMLNCFLLVLLLLLLLNAQMTLVSR